MTNKETDRQTTLRATSVAIGHIYHYVQTMRPSASSFLANVNYVTFAIMLSPVRLSSACLSVVCLSVTLVRFTQAVAIFGNFFTIR